jgi:hypothetical protein
MKRIHTITTIVLLLIALSFYLQAQERPLLTATVPFAFGVANVSLPAIALLPGRTADSANTLASSPTALKSATISKSSSGSWRKEGALPDSQKKTKRSKRRTIETSQNLTDGVE